MKIAYYTLLVANLICKHRLGGLMKKLLSISNFSFWFILLSLCISYFSLTACRSYPEVSQLAIATPQSEWVALTKKATRFPYYQNEPEPRDSRACHEGFDDYGRAGAHYFIAVADTSPSDILWPGLPQCQCQDGSARCGGPSCNQSICGKKVLIRCAANDTSCQSEYRGKSIVVMIRDVCPQKHQRNQDQGHCQWGNQIDIYRNLYVEMTGGYDGDNLYLEFAAVDQNSPLGPTEGGVPEGPLTDPEGEPVLPPMSELPRRPLDPDLPTFPPSSFPSNPGCSDTPPDDRYTCAQQAVWGKCQRDWMIKDGGYCNRTCGRC